MSAAVRSPADRLARMVARPEARNACKQSADVLFPLGSATRQGCVYEGGRNERALLTLASACICLYVILLISSAEYTSFMSLRKASSSFLLQRALELALALCAAGMVDVEVVGVGVGVVKLDEVGRQGKVSLDVCGVE